MKLIGLLAALGCALFCGRADAAGTKAQLLLSHASAKPGDKITAAVKLTMPPRWHTYWKFGGDSGAPTKIVWELPAGISAGEIQWPLPEKLTVAGLTTYVYNGEVALLVPLEIASWVSPGTLQLKAKISWLECDESCIPGRAEVETTLAIGSESKPSPDAALIQQTRAKLPEPMLPPDVLASWASAPNGESRNLAIQVAERAASADFYPYASEDYDVSGETERTATAIIKKIKKSGEKWPEQIAGVLVFGEGAQRKGYEANFRLSTPAVAGNSGSSAIQRKATAPLNSATSLPQASLAAMLGAAFLGGLILNIMPCVLPVIALKILGFVGQAREQKRRIRQLGLVYAAGVIASFLVLAGFVIAIKTAGGLASWGMQFQNPKFLVAMTVLVTLVAMNLFGVFEVTLSGRAMGAAGDLASKEGAAGAFFNGVLATALATPCSAPFLGVALGFAFAQPPATIALMFATVGLGLAAPYVVLCWQPGWLRFLPKPGAWMEKFKMGMGFPMLATAVWLYSLTAAHFGKAGTLWIGVFLVLIALAAWIWGEFVQRGRTGRSLAVVFSLAALLTAYFGVLEHELSWRTPVRTAALASSNSNGMEVVEITGDLPWYRWNPEAVVKARAQGKPVLVDFTADWCLTCQVNKKTSLTIDSVRAKLKEIGAVTFIGDYTNEDPAIGKELQRHNRAAVPLVLVYPSDLSAPPIVLPELLKPGIVLDALDKARRNVAAR